MVIQENIKFQKLSHGTRYSEHVCGTHDGLRLRVCPACACEHALQQKTKPKRKKNVTAIIHNATPKGNWNSRRIRYFVRVVDNIRCIFMKLIDL